MRSITHCPSCQTEFFVTEEQLNQHQGQVRCGQCLHVFNAREQFIQADIQSESVINLVVEPTATETFVEKTTPSTTIGHPEDKPYNFEDEVKSDKSNSNSDSQKFKPALTVLLTLILILAAAGQTIYFLRNEMAIHLPQLKPYLVQACASISCSIDLPKKIELIVIDDSDMQEDTTYVGLMHLSSTLINQAHFNQAYPNVEVTLTDVDDKPKLRRTFKPSEYLPDHTNIEDGIPADQELKINLALTTQNIAVAGYRVFVTY
jgi:predicted Zn finger-like uncharacterized protein